MGVWHSMDKPRTIHRILLFVLLAALVPGLIVQALLHLQCFTAVQAKEIQGNRDVARAVAAAFQANIQDVARELYAFGLTMSRFAPADHEAASRYLADAKQRNPGAIELAWLSPEGRVIASSRNSAIGEDRHADDCLKGLGEDRPWVLGPVQPEGQTGAATFTVAHLLSDEQDRLRGVLTIAMDAERFADARIILNRTPDASFIVLDNHGVVAFCRPSFAFSGWQARDFSKERFVAAALAGQEACGQLDLPQMGETCLTARTPIAGLGWVAGAGRSYQAVMAPLWRDLGLGAGLSILGLLLSGSIAMHYGKMILKDLHGLHNAVTAWGQCRETAARPAVGSIAELGAVADAFDAATTLRMDAERALCRSETRYRELVQNANSAIIRWSRSGTIGFVNEYARNLFGWNADEAIGAHVGILVPGALSTGAPEAGFNQDVIDHPERHANIINECVCRDGRRVWMTWTNRAIRDEAGRVVEILSIGNDITERKHAEEALRQLNATLEQRVAERTELAEARARQLQSLAAELIEAEERERRRVAGLLHDDLQQILVSARIQLQVARAGLPAEPILANVEQLLDQSIGKSRRLSRELSPAVLQHAGLVEALQWLAGQMRDRFGLHVALEARMAQPFESPTLKVFLFRAAQELLFNVVKHAGVKSARVMVSGTGRSLALTVSDQGRGFNPAILATPSAGNLGLISLRERTRYIGGELIIDSSPEKGSAFSLTVPIDPAGSHQHQPPEADHQTLAQIGPAAGSGKGNIRVLFVDDHKVMRQGLVRLMASQPVIRVVGEAADGLEAIAQARQLKPDVIVMDVSMPVMNGIEATRQIKAEFNEVKVIGLSMHEDEQLAASMREAGAEAFVCKSASSAELLKAIYGITGLKQFPSC